MRLALACILLMLPLAAADDGGPLSADHSKLHGQGSTKGSTVPQLTAADQLWLTTLKEDPDAERYMSYQSYDEANEFEWRFVLPSEAFQRVELDPAGIVTMTAYLGTGVSTYAFASLDADLVQGETIIADGTPKENIYGANGYAVRTWTVAPSVTYIDPADGPLEYVIKATGAASSVSIQTAAYGDTGVDLPIIGGTMPGPVYTNITAPTFNIDASYQNATTGTYIYNWTSPHTNVTFGYTAALAGNATLNITAPDGTVTDLTLGEGSQTFTSTAGAGDWTFRLTLADATGSLELFADLTPEAMPTAEDPDTPDSPDETNTTASDDPQAIPVEKDTPIPLGIALIALLIARRR